MFQNSWFAVFITFVILAAGCGTKAPVSSKSASATATSAARPSENRAETDPRKIAANAKDEMFQTLSTKLLEAMGQGGPAAAIEICSKDAPKVADKVGAKFGVQIGRTSFKLRNSKNAPPEWVQPVINDRPVEARFVNLPDGHTGAVFPIMLKVQCLACHGPAEQIADQVQNQLSRLYPEDQATGFNEGDLRGWFWVNVPDPAAAAAPNPLSK